MKLQTLIDRLEKAKTKYICKHGTEPSIYSCDEDGILLCSKVEKPMSELRIAKRPYLKIKTGLEKLL